MPPVLSTSTSSSRKSMTAVKWPTNSTKNVPELASLLEKCRAAADTASAGKSKPPSLKNTNQSNEPIRRGSREIQSRFLNIDGNNVLKVNNYSLEEGEKSVWGQEAVKTKQPKKPPCAYALFQKAYTESPERFKHYLDQANETENSMVDDTVATHAAAFTDAVKYEGEDASMMMVPPLSFSSGVPTVAPTGVSMMATSGVVDNFTKSRNDRTSVWKNLDSADREKFEYEADVLKEKYLEELEEYEDQFERAQEKKRQQNSYLFNRKSGDHQEQDEENEDIAAGSESSIALARTSRRSAQVATSKFQTYSKHDEVNALLDKHPEGLTLSQINYMISNNTDIQWFDDKELMRILSEGLKKGTIRRISVDLSSDLDLLYTLNDKFKSTEAPTSSDKVISVMSDDEVESSGGPSLLPKGSKVLILYDEEWWEGAIISVGANIYRVQFDFDSTFCELPHDHVKLMPSKLPKFKHFNESSQAQITSETVPDLSIIARLNLEIKLRELVLKAVVNIVNNTNKAPSTVDLPELSLNALEMAELKGTLSLRKFANHKSVIDFLVSSSALSSCISDEIYPGWLQHGTGKNKFKRPGWNKMARNGVEMEMAEITAASKEKRLWLGRVREDGVWEISKSCFGPAVQYILMGLSESGHLCYEASAGGFLPGHIYVPGPPFPSTESKSAATRRLHNEKLSSRYERNLLSVAKYAVAHMDVVEPFLDPKVAENLRKRSKLSFDSNKEFLERDGTSEVMSVEAPLLKQPSRIVGEMRDYQLKGFSFMVNCYRYGVNCVLADEMGLGKTIQTIAYLTYITLGDQRDTSKSNKKAKTGATTGGASSSSTRNNVDVEGDGGPSLVVLPLSVLTSWMQELKRFSPELRVVRLHSSDEKERERLRSDVLSNPANFDVVVTTYEMLQSPTLKNVLSRIWWRCMVLDEGHKIKNELSNVSIASRKVHAAHRVILTGTPLQNNLHELWALLNYLTPEVFVSSTPFDECFDITLGQVDNDMLDKAYYLMKLFSLRRLKSEVEVSLPPKRELKILLPLSAYQLHFYRCLLMKDFDAIQSASEDVNGAGASTSSNDVSSAIHPDKNRHAALADLDIPVADETRSDWKRLQSLMMQLRKTCNHPYLFSGADPNPEVIDENIIESSSKMAFLDRLLPKLQKNGHRVLIFSQFTMMLDILDDYCKHKQYNYTRLDGSNNRVQRSIDVRSFNQEGSDLFIFLMSTRAGGLGINLQTADTVILFDSDWNPQVDLQAIGRVHRIGQKKPCHIYRLITEGTIEERIYDRAQKKLYLSEMVNRDEAGALQQNERLGKKELVNMLTIGADTIFNSSGKLPTSEEIDAMIDRTEGSTWTQNSSQNTDNAAGNAAAVIPSESASLSLSSGFQKSTGAEIDFSVARPLSEFQGIVYDRTSAPQNTVDIANVFLGKREKNSRTVVVDGVTILKTNNYEVKGDRYVFEGEERRKVVEKTDTRQIAGRDYTHDSNCLYCWDGGDLICCDGCPAVFHPACLGYSEKETKALSKAKKWTCPHHRCSDCGKNSAAAGGLLFRCEVCPEAFCEDHLPIDADILGGCQRFEDLGMRKPSQACYIHCSTDCHNYITGANKTSS